MQLFAFGVNHKTAPVDVREKLAFPEERLAPALREVCSNGDAGEAAILSTCNRTEVYAGAQNENIDRAVEWLCDNARISCRELQPHLYRHTGSDAVKHAFRVASGLVSLVLGEPQILGQMKTAFTLAHKAGATGKMLNKMFQQTFSVAKKVRTDTAIGASAVSVAYAAVALARQIFSDLGERTVMLIGAGEMIELAVRHLSEAGIGRIIVANRTVEKAQALADDFNGQAIALMELPDRLHEADIVISSTGSQLPLIGKGMVENALKKRKHRPMFLVDIAVPRDMEPEIGNLSDVYLYTVDDLQQVVEQNMEARRDAAREAEHIIDVEVGRFMHWVRSLDAEPVIRTLREQANDVSQQELQKAIKLLNKGEEPEKVIAQLARSLTNKLTHAPSHTLRTHQFDEHLSMLDAARTLFNLDDE